MRVCMPRACAWAFRTYLEGGAALEVGRCGQANRTPRPSLPRTQHTHPSPTRSFVLWYSVPPLAVTDVTGTLGAVMCVFGLGLAAAAAMHVGMVRGAERMGRGGRGGGAR